MIKELGTNGGGYFNANSAHPFENPNAFTNLFEIFLLLLIPSVPPRTFGRMVGNLKQLVARVRAAVRRATPAAGAELETVVTRDFTVDLGARRVLRNGQPIRLTPTEWSLLEVLIRHAGKLVPQRQLLVDVWEPAYEGESHYLRVYLAQLRRKLEPDPAHPRYLITEAGMGYRFENPG